MSTAHMVAVGLVAVGGLLGGPGTPSSRVREWGIALLLAAGLVLIYAAITSEDSSIFMVVNVGAPTGLLAYCLWTVRHDFRSGDDTEVGRPKPDRTDTTGSSGQ